MNISIPRAEFYSTDPPKYKPVGEKVNRTRETFCGISGTKVTRESVSYGTDRHGDIVDILTEEHFVAFIADDGTEYTAQQCYELIEKECAAEDETK